MLLCLRISVWITAPKRAEGVQRQERMFLLNSAECLSPPRGSKGYYTNIVSTLRKCVAHFVS